MKILNNFIKEQKEIKVKVQTPEPKKVNIFIEKNLDE